MDTMMIYLVILLLSFGLILRKKYITKIKRNSYKSNITLDNVPNDFEQIYQKLYAENIYSLEIMRKKVRFRKIFQYRIYCFRNQNRNYFKRNRLIFRSNRYYIICSLVSICI